MIILILFNLLLELAISYKTRIVEIRPSNNMLRILIATTVHLS